jgi:thiol:disulfide interchange protein
MDLSPRGLRGQALTREVLDQLGVSGEQMAAFTLAHPDIVERESGALRRRIDAARDRVLPALGAAAKALPAEAPPAPSASRASSSAPLAGWTPVSTLEELRRNLGGDRSVVVLFRAAWLIPGLELERKVLSQPAVRARLAGYTRLFVDVSDEDSPAQKVLESFGTPTLPALFVYPRSGPLRDYLAGKARRPEAALSLDHLVSEPELLARLPH